MSYEMSLYRKTDLSLFHYIKDIVLDNFIEIEDTVQLKYMPQVSTAEVFVYEALTEMVPKPTERGRGWVYFDDGLQIQCLRNTATYSGTPEQSNRVVVYSVSASGTLEVIPDTEYIIDYVDGRVITSGTVTPEYITYYWNYVSVVDEWAAIEAADPPVVVLDMQGIDKAGFQLGGGIKDTRKVDIHIFASSTAERNDIVETIYNGLYNKSIPIYDFPEGDVLEYDGTFHLRKENMDKQSTLFSRALLPNVSNLYFDKVTARHVNLPLVMNRSRNEVLASDLNAYRSKISLDIFLYQERG
jgi:hypothetical protein